MKGLEMVKCESLRINMFRITHTGKVNKFSRNNADKDAVVVDWTSLAPEPGIKMPSVIQKPRRPSSTI